MGRIRYCPTCGRTDASDLAERISEVGFFAAVRGLCSHCLAWYNGVHPFHAKWSSES